MLKPNGTPQGDFKAEILKEIAFASDSHKLSWQTTVICLMEVITYIVGNAQWLKPKEEPQEQPQEIDQS